MATSLTPDTLVVVKVAIDGNNRKFKLPLQDLNAASLAPKLRSVLHIPNEQANFDIERFSDSSGTYIRLSDDNPSTYKQLYRAAKAKLKLRLKITLPKVQADEALLAGGAAVEAAPELLVDTQAEEPVLDLKKPLPIVYQLDPSEHDAEPSVSVDPSSKTKDLNHDIPVLPTCWQVFCNSCDKILTDVHYHCSICDKGDYDLCEACVAVGKSCDGTDHWLIKRSIKDGRMINSTTETIAPVSQISKTQKAEAVPPVPDLERAWTLQSRLVELKLEQADGLAETLEVPTSTTQVPNANSSAQTTGANAISRRTCNSCVMVLPVTSFVTCTHCEDYDLCTTCVVAGKHGHHPGHSFKAAIEGMTMDSRTIARCQGGGNSRHFAICDGCDHSISGIRHKCIDCPDWDFCSKCFETAPRQHPGHRFVPLYEPIKSNYHSQRSRHVGIYCDGPLCSDQVDQNYIRGIRYKCAICHDKDFCANCEAHPTNKHNITHPMIKFKTPVRNASIQTTGSNGTGEALPTMGDKTGETGSSEAASSVKHDFQAIDHTAAAPPAYTPVSAKTRAAYELVHKDRMLFAEFVRDTVHDGANVEAGAIFSQSWTLRNPGPLAWPSGCRLVSTGGDDMICDEGSEHELDLSTVQPGQEKTFTVQLRTSAREGKHISYWRLKTAEGLAFGHKLWCDVNATKAASVSSIGRPTVEAPKSESRTLAQRQYDIALAVQRKRMEQAQLARTKLQQAAHIAGRAAGKAWTSPPEVAPATPGSSEDDNGIQYHAQAKSNEPSEPSKAAQEQNRSKTRQMRISELLLKPEDLAKSNQEKPSNTSIDKIAKLEKSEYCELTRRHAERKKADYNAAMAAQTPQEIQLMQPMHPLPPMIPSHTSVYTPESLLRYKQERAKDQAEMNDLRTRHLLRREGLGLAAAAFVSPQFHQHPMPVMPAMNTEAISCPPLSQPLPQHDYEMLQRRQNIQLAATHQRQQLERWQLQQQQAHHLSSDQSGQSHLAGDPAYQLAEPFTALEDYQMQLMLLEQQNKKRLLLARGQLKLPKLEQPNQESWKSDDSTLDEQQKASAGSPAATISKKFHRSDYEKHLNRFMVKDYKHSIPEQEDVQIPAPTAQSPPAVPAKEIEEISRVSNMIAPKAAVNDEEERFASANASLASSTKMPKPATVEDVELAVEEARLSDSHMVFPKLEKESPANSTHLEDSAMTAPSSTNPISNVGSATPSVAAPPSTVGTETTAGDVDLEHEDFEEVGTVHADDDGEDYDSGFDTDDYDILDASDEE